MKAYIEIEVDVDFDYEPASGDGWHEPRYPEHVDMNSVTFKGRDIMEELDQETLDQLLAECYDYVEEQAIAALEDRAEAAWEQRQMSMGIY